MLQTQYAVSVWLSAHATEDELHEFINSGFIVASGMSGIDTDFVEALCYRAPVHLFDVIDQVSYGKYFRSECVKMLYPQQFSGYCAAIFVYGRKDEKSTINRQVFEPVAVKPSGKLLHAGTIPFEIPDTEK